MTPLFHYDTSHIKWTHLDGGPEFDYPIDYELAVLGCRGLSRPAREVCTELLLPLPSPRRGHHHPGPGGDVHKECGGPEGAIVFFAMQSPTGHVFDLLDADGNTLASSTVEEMGKDLLSV